MHTLPYLEFVLAQGQPVSPNHRAQARYLWQQQQRILQSPEALGCEITVNTVADAVKTIRERYPDLSSYLADLAAHRLDEALLSEALSRQLQVEAALEVVRTRVPRVTAMEAEIFYWQHHARFLRAEARQASHILITVNAELPGNRAPEARQRLDGVARELAADPTRFAELALRHSECPTALEGGTLGWVPRGKLYPELDAALFAMAEQELRPVESPMGWHLLRCDAIRPEAPVDFSEVQDKLQATLQQRREQKAERQWLDALKYEAINAA